ncbi:hypothetical protein L9G74_13945 [Shewanella sp. C32]|uniref:DUF2541 domain-containing protein n=1 Tax=Shewanella electrica TaxID=515560 RepID=A0ABT2FMI6_9GAMM|nr:hypothetical protein [Shewanella electrica]MCH1926082.1 hypothetical protein [Shewanella electrica]MCS4557549.1 hypothetical protein [Shewanella electrica]
MKLIPTITLAAMTTLFSLHAVAGDKDWEKIADKKVSFQAETDTVKPLSPFADSHFSQLKIKCTQGTVNLKKIKVHMSDGNTKEFDSLGTLTKGMSSRSLNLPDKDGAKLQKLELTYESMGSAALNVAGVTKHAEVEILAKKSGDK